MFKAHIGSNGAGSKPICASRHTSTSGYVVTRERFLDEPESFRCKRCAKKAAKSLAKLLIQ